MSIVARIATLTRRRTNARTDDGERRYGRLDRTSSTTAAVSASSRGPSSRTDRDTPRSYLSDDFGHRFCPVLDRMALDDAAAQFGADRRPGLRPGRPDRHQDVCESSRVPRRSEQRQRQVAQKRRQGCVRRHDRARTRRGLVDGLVERGTRGRLEGADDDVGPADQQQAPRCAVRLRRRARVRADDRRSRSPPPTRPGGRARRRSAKGPGSREPRRGPGRAPARTPRAASPGPSTERCARTRGAAAGRRPGRAAGPRRPSRRWHGRSRGPSVRRRDSWPCRRSARRCRARSRAAACDRRASACTRAAAGRAERERAARRARGRSEPCARAPRPPRRATLPAAADRQAPGRASSGLRRCAPARRRAPGPSGPHGRGRRARRSRAASAETRSIVWARRAVRRVERLRDEHELHQRAPASTRSTRSR